MSTLEQHRLSAIEDRIEEILRRLDKLEALQPRCSWIVGEEGNEDFCGEPATFSYEGSPLCDKHRRELARHLAQADRDKDASGSR